MPPEVAFLIEAVRSAPSADNSQPWCFQWDGKFLTFRVHLRGTFPIDHPATSLALGAASENLCRAIVSLGLDLTSWYLDVPQEDGIFAQGPVARQSHAIDPFITPLWKLRHTNRLPYRLEIDQDIMHRFGACSMNKVGVEILVGADIQRAAGWVRQASEIRFQTRVVHEWFASSLRYETSGQDVGDGLHVNTLVLPPGGVWLLKLISDWHRMQWLNRLGAYKLFAAIEAANFQKTRLIIAIIGPSGSAPTFDAGRCLQKVWLKVTELGLSAHPYYVVSDVLNRLESGGVPVQCMAQALDVQASVRALLGSDITLHCLLRVGKPIGTVQVSGRIPLKDLVCNTINRIDDGK